MSDSEKIKKLYAVIAKQQVIIGELVKRAQVAPAHRNEVTHGLTDTQKDPSRGHQTPGQTAAPAKQPGKLTRDIEAEAVIKALPPLVKAVLKDLKVNGSNVLVKFHPGKGSDAAFNAIQSVVTALQNKNVLKGKSYQIQEIV